MNNTRRKELKMWIKKIDGLKDDLGYILSDEQDYYDNIPENLQSSLHATSSEEAIEGIEEAMEIIDEVIEKIEEVILA